MLFLWWHTKIESCCLVLRIHLLKAIVTHHHARNTIVSLHVSIKLLLLTWWKSTCRHIHIVSIVHRLENHLLLLLLHLHHVLLLRINGHITLEHWIWDEFFLIRWWLVLERTECWVSSRARWERIYRSLINRWWLISRKLTLG